MGLTAWAAAWFLLAAVPISAFVAFSDMARMKIPNQAVVALVAAYAVLGLIALPFEQYLWHWVHIPVLLAVGIVLNIAGAMGAGDAKFIAASGPFLATGDIRLIIVIYAASLLGAFATHRIAKYSPLRAMVPHWASWETTKMKFPMGFPLGMTLVFYLAIIALTR